MTPERLAELKKKLEPVEHIHTGPGKCSCGFDAYKIRGIMIDYLAETQDHFRRNQRTTPGQLTREESRELIAEVERVNKHAEWLQAKITTALNVVNRITGRAGTVQETAIMAILEDPR